MAAMTRWILVTIALILVLSPLRAVAQVAPEIAPESAAQSESLVFMFGREDCGFCQAQFDFLAAEDIEYRYLDIVTDPEAKRYFDAVTEKHGIPKVTPVTVVGSRVIVGFNGPDTTGASILAAIESQQASEVRTLDAHLARAPVQEVVVGGGCTGIACEVGQGGGYVFDLPFIGTVDLQTFSLFSLSLLLGVIDGFNPCAMWVLVTFLMLLSQAGSRQKMIFLAGLFIVAQGIMYNLILNVWYQTWDFVALDQFVTPLVGFIALGGGLFFLWRWHKNKRAELVCDISDIETQSKTIDKFRAIVHQPVTLASIGAILVIAFSINIIEFACSIGIPQAYTKILELNVLTFLERQWYILLFTLGYMFDDLVVFALAIWGFSKLQAHGAKYAQWSLLIGGVLMLILGLILILNPQLLVF